MSCSNSGHSEIEAPDNRSKTSEIYFADSFKILNTQIIDGLISRENVLQKLKQYLPKLKEYYFSKNYHKTKQEQKFFPLKHYIKSAIDGINGNGFIEQGYDYFKGNKQLGHPAQDMFVDLCDIVKPNQKIATTGRAVFDTFKKRSPSYLHFMALKIASDSYQRPINLYDELIKAKTR